MKSPRHSSSLISEALRLPDPADQLNTEDGSVDCPKPGRFSFMFPLLQKDEANLLPEGPETVRALVKLGKMMIDKQPLDQTFDTTIPSVYTYFGQFIVHDLTLDPNSNTVRLFEEDVESLNPLSIEEINGFENVRSGLLDLDSVYGPILDNNKCLPVPRTGEQLRVEITANGNVPGTDLPRLPDPPYKARIGDARNDENLVISQMHLAFLRAHNVLVKAGASFADARAFLRRRYQQLVVNDFLPKVVDASDIAWAQNNKIFNPAANGYFIPVEFSAAALRFGHAMVRSRYFYNAVRKFVRLDELFMLKALTSYHHILEEWIIDWNNFVQGGTNVARNLAPRLIEPLAEFLTAGPPPAIGQPAKRPILSLAVVDLVRGYLFRLPTGQAVAKAVDLIPISSGQIEAVAARVSEEQAKVLHETGLSQRTPLWYYILAEADYYHNGNRLGPVGGRLIASVLLEAANRSHDFQHKEDGWDPILGKEEGFDLGELLRHASV